MITLKAQKQCSENYSNVILLKDSFRYLFYFLAMI